MARLLLWVLVVAVCGVQPIACSAAEAADAPASKTEPAKSGRLIVAPIPFLNPTLENGLVMAAGYLFRPDRQDKVSPISAAGGAYFRTSNSSNGYGGGAKLYLKEEILQIKEEVLELFNLLQSLSEQHKEVLLPG